MNAHYWHLRLTFYRQSIKEMRETIQQLGMAVVVLFQVAIPAVFLFFLMGLGQLAEPEQPTSNYVAWLGGYGVLIYGVIRFQRQAILALPVKFWDNSLPVGSGDRVIVVILLCLLAGNVFLLLPVGLLIYLLLSHIPESLSVDGLKQLWPLLISCLWGIQSMLLALYRRRFPLLTLVLLPVFVWLMDSLGEQPWWLLMLMLGPVLGFKTDKAFWQGKVKLHFFWQLLLVHQCKNWQSALLKMASLTLCCIFFATMAEQVSTSTRHWVVLCCIFISASLTSTIQFSLNGFKQQYRYFLSSLPVSGDIYRRQFLLFTGAVGATFLLVTCLFIGFSMLIVVAWTLFFCIGVWSINRFRQRFFIPLIAVFGGLSAALAMSPLS